MERADKEVSFECKTALLELEPIPIRERIAIGKYRPSLDELDTWRGGDYHFE